VNVPNPGLIESRYAPQIFEVRPTPFMLNPILQNDELMIHWRDIPSGSEAEIYLPEASADEILDLAGQMYSTRLLKRTDDHTLSCSTGGVTYIPIPRRKGQNYAGLMTIKLPPTVKKGNAHSIIVRQVTSAMMGIDSIKVRGRGDNIGIAATIHRSKEDDVPPASSFGLSTDVSSSARPTFIQWRRVLGEFELTIPISTKQALLAQEERRLSIFRHIQLSISLTSRWYLVFQRYVQQIEGRVRDMGGDPDKVIPTNDGNWQQHDGGKEKDQYEEEEHKHEWEHRRREHLVSFYGKIESLIYDRYGDFEGFTLDTEDGTRRFENREKAIEELVDRARKERLPITVFAERHDIDEPQLIMLGASHDE
jgi:hypothetical protein